MEQGLGVLLLILITAICLVALFTTLRVLFPEVVGRTTETIESMPGRSFVLGLVNFLFLGAIGLGFAALSDALSSEFFFFPALILAAALAIGLTFGLASTATLLGQRVSPDGSRWRQTVLGGSMLILASLTPFLGWFLLFPYLGLVGLGGFILRWFRRAANQPEAG